MIAACVEYGKRSAKWDHRVKGVPPNDQSLCVQKVGEFLSCESEVNTYRKLYRSKELIRLAEDIGGTLIGWSISTT